MMAWGGGDGQACGVVGGRGCRGLLGEEGERFALKKRVAFTTLAAFPSAAGTQVHRDLENATIAANSTHFFSDPRRLGHRNVHPVGTHHALSRVFGWSGGIAGMMTPEGCCLGL